MEIMQQVLKMKQTAVLPKCIAIKMYGRFCTFFQDEQRSLEGDSFCSGTGKIFALFGCYTV
jgi:hypothetical protein